MSAPAHPIHYTYAEYLAFEGSSDVAQLPAISARLDVRELYEAASDPTAAA